MLDPEITADRLASTKRLRTGTLARRPGLLPLTVRQDGARLGRHRRLRVTPPPSS